MSTKPFSVDPSFPQLEVAADPELMREVFQGHLRPLGEEAYQVREVGFLTSATGELAHRRLQYALQYTLRLEEPLAGRERSQLVTGVMYAGGMTRRIWKKLRRSNRPGRKTFGASPAFAPFSCIPDLDMLV